MKPNWKIGSCLTSGVQLDILRCYIHRYTGEHKPLWSLNPGSRNARPTASTDLAWLARNAFAVRKDGQLDNRVKHCRSHDGVDWCN